MENVTKPNECITPEYSHVKLYDTEGGLDLVDVDNSRCINLNDFRCKFADLYIDLIDWPESADEDYQRFMQYKEDTNPKSGYPYPLLIAEVRGGKITYFEENMGAYGREFCGFPRKEEG